MSRYSGVLKDRKLTDDAIMWELGHFCGYMSDNDIDRLHILMKLCYRRGLIDESIQQEYWHKRMLEDSGTSDNGQTKK